MRRVHSPVLAHYSTNLTQLYFSVSCTLGALPLHKLSACVLFGQILAHMALSIEPELMKEATAAAEEANAAILNITSKEFPNKVPLKAMLRMGLGTVDID